MCHGQGVGGAPGDGGHSFARLFTTELQKTQGVPAGRDAWIFFFAKKGGGMRSRLFLVFFCFWGGRKVIIKVTRNATFSNFCHFKRSPEFLTSKSLSFG